MAVCQCCGASFAAGRRDAKYCSARCRQAARRARLRADREAKRHMLTLESRAMLDRLAAVLPVTAARMENFIEANGAECTEAAIKLCLTAYTEAAGVK